MLQIYTDNQLTDLPDDVSIDLTFENPLFSPDRIPATYSLSYELPLTPRNRSIFGNPDRIALAGDRFREHPTRILFAGLEVASGVQIIEEIGESITVNFSGSVLPENIGKHLQNIPMDVYDLTGYNSSISNAQVNLDGMMRRNMTDADAPFFCPPIAIKDVERMERDPDNPEDILLNTRARWLNAMNLPVEVYLHYLKGSGTFYALKLLPAVRVWYIIEKILGSRLQRNIFREGEWKKLCLQTLWHPDYNLNTNLPPWRRKDDKNVTWAVADFMPDVAAGDFIVEMLKLPCASMYIKGDTFSVEYNGDILRRNVVHDWTDKIIGTPTLTSEPGQEYRLEFSARDEGEQPEGEIKEVKTVINALEYLAGRTYVNSCRVENPPQVLTAILDEVGRTPSVVKQEDMPATADTEESELESDTAGYDMSIGAKVVTCNIHRYWLNDDDMDKELSNEQKFYVPEIEKLETKRPDTILLGLAQGMQKEIKRWNIPVAYRYPYLSATNYNAYGEKLGELSLFQNGTGALFERYHKPFAEWIARKKLKLTGAVYLRPIDLHRLDLRDKFNIRGRLFFLETMNVSLKKNRIEPAEAEFVEA